ncbi:Carbon-nitrogen hydrolase [Massospora cicadina]|nr:Carbon-nitrogen hydrolase [Massospora cicadina]
MDSSYSFNHEPTALIQLKVGTDKRTNLESAKAKVLEASSVGKAEVECFNSPYGTQYFSSYAEPIPEGETSNALARMAEEAKVYLIGGTWQSLAFGFNSGLNFIPPGFYIRRTLETGPRPTWSYPLGFLAAVGSNLRPIGLRLHIGSASRLANFTSGSIPEVDPRTGKLYNTCTVYGPDGTLTRVLGAHIATHRKVHLFDIDIPGKIRFKVIDTEFGSG